MSIWTTCDDAPQTDGFSDNVFPSEMVTICSLVARAGGTEDEQVQAMADRLVDYSRQCMKSKLRVSPFESELLFSLFFLEVSPCCNIRFHHCYRCRFNSVPFSLHYGRTLIVCYGHAAAARRMGVAGVGYGYLFSHNCEAILWQLFWTIFLSFTLSGEASRVGQYFRGGVSFSFFTFLSFMKLFIDPNMLSLSLSLVLSRVCHILSSSSRNQMSSYPFPLLLYELNW